jgi:hypothetical protein
MKVKILLILVACCVLLTACIPAIKSVYHTPRVTGIVVDAACQPLAGVVVRHADYDEPQVVTDAAGRFILPSVHNVEVVMLMAGHALKVYPIQFTTPLSSQVVEVFATMMMYQEETITFDRAVMMDLGGDMKLNQQGVN